MQISGKSGDKKDELGRSDTRKSGFKNSAGGALIPTLVSFESTSIRIISMEAGAKERIFFTPSAASNWRRADSYHEFD